MLKDQKNKSTVLLDAFELFQQASEQLVTSYVRLEDEVSQLNQQLQQARQERQEQSHQVKRLVNQMQNIVEALPVALVVINKLGFVVQCNPAAEDMLGKPLLGESWALVIEKNFKPQGELDYQVRLKNDRVVNVLTNVMSDEPGQIVVLTDISVQHELESLVQRQKRLSAMGEMVARIAHQIRTPLTSSVLYLSQLLNKSLEEKTRQQFLGRTYESLQHLNSLINDMLRFTQGGSLPVQRILLGDFVAELTRIAEGLMQNGNADIHIADIHSDSQHQNNAVLGNAAALISAFENLLVNAIEAGGGQPITLGVAVGGEFAHFFVEDKGPGISKQILERIFEPFFTTKKQGTGLGLAVVKAVVEAHHGFISVDSRPGLGARFVIRIPLANALANPLVNPLVNQGASVSAQARNSL